MKSHKSITSIIASLTMLLITFTIAAPSSLGAAETRNVVNLSGQPNWADHNTFTQDAIIVNNQAGYVIWVTFRDNTGNAISNFSVAIGATSSAQALPQNAVSICVAKTQGGVPEDCLYATCYIPTLSEWAMILFGVVLLSLMTYYVVKKRKVARMGSIA